MKKTSRQYFVSSSIDPSAEVAEPHLLLEENSFPYSSIIPKDDDPKRINTLIEAIHTDMFKKEEEEQQQPQKSLFQLFNRKSIPIDIQPLSNEIKTVTFNDDPIDTPESPNDSIPINFPIQDLNNLLSETEYIPGGFANLDDELEQEFLNDFDDEFDEEITRRNRYISSIRSSDHIINISRSPIELWQRARILIAVHLYKIQNKTFTSPMISNPSIKKIVDDTKLFEQKENLEEQKLTFGLSIIQQITLEPSQQYQCVDFYDVEQDYIFMCNIINSEINTKQAGILVYPINKKSLNKTQIIEFDCPYQFDFMHCIPTFRLILGFINIKNEKSLLILIGDTSRKGIFLSKQEIPYHIHSFLYIPETSMLFLGCTGRILLYNTQPFQFISQPIFISEFDQFESIEPIIHICHVRTHRSIGILTHQYFVLYQYNFNENILMKFCNPYRYDFIRCHYNSKYDYIIYGFIDGLILIYELNEMTSKRRYKNHWKRITDLKTTKNEDYLLSSSIDFIINIYYLENLQHVYQYNTFEEIYQINIIHENLFYYQTLKNLILFKLNLHTLVFSIVKTKILSLKLFTDTQRISRILALADDYSSILISPVSGSCLTYIPNLSQKPIKQIIHDISRSSIYSLQFNGEITFYNTDNNPCVAQYKIRTKSEQNAITCMTIINPIRTHLFNINLTEKSLEKQLIFFGHANGYISLFQGDLLTMEPILAHQNSVICLETSQASMEISNITFTNCEIILSSSIDRTIYLWDLIKHQSNDSIELIHILTIEQEKNLSSQSIKYLLMIDNFIVGNYSDQKFLHIWQLLNISIKINSQAQWGIVEHPTKGNHHHGQIQAISAISKLKLFASSDIEGIIKIWDNTNSLIREICLDKSVYSIEFLSQNGELILSYQNNIHLIFPEDYLLNNTKFKLKQQNILNNIAEDNRLEINQPFYLSYQSLPIFYYNIKTHHEKKNLQRFQRQLAGRYAVIESDNSESDINHSISPNPDHLSIISDDSSWSELDEHVKDILRMKKQLTINNQKGR